MNYALITLWHERQRFVPAVLAVGFSMLLITLQSGLLLGQLELMSTPVDRAAADLWVGHPKVRSVDLGRAIPRAWTARLAVQPEVERVDPYVQGAAYWIRPCDGGPEVCMVIGACLDRDSLGAVDRLREDPELRARLAEPGGVVVDESELDRLGLKPCPPQPASADVDEAGPDRAEINLRRAEPAAEINGQRVRVVGRVSGLGTLGGPYVFCSLETARRLLHQPADQTTYLLARCRDPGAAEQVVARLGRYGDTMSAFTGPAFSRRSRLYWLFRTKAGVALGCCAVLGLLVGAVVTGQTLYAATAASLREYAVLQAQGIPRWRIRGAVLAQSFWVGVAGVGLTLPLALLLAAAGGGLGIQVRLDPRLVGGAAAVTMAMALLSGLVALRSLRQLQPVQLLR
jgi:putative ABC transport system permease protein